LIAVGPGYKGDFITVTGDQDAGLGVFLHEFQDLLQRFKVLRAQAVLADFELDLSL
jgi:hypothetical protein